MAEQLLLTSEQVAEALSICVRTVWRMVERGELPQPIRYNRKLVRWRAADIREHVDGGANVRGGNS